MNFLEIPESISDENIAWLRGTTESSDDKDIFDLWKSTFKDRQEVFIGNKKNRERNFDEYKKYCCLQSTYGASLVCRLVFLEF